MNSAYERFLRDLVRNGFMSDEELSAYLGTFPSEKRPGDAATLARVLVRDEKLTPYQAKAMLDGRADSLVLGGYVLVDKIGEGGMGQVIKAVHRSGGQLAAVKVMRVEWLESPSAIRRFHQEVEVANRLRHENIVATYSAGEHEGTHYLAMEYVEGRDLAAIVDRGGALPVSEAVGYIIQAAKGLGYAHSQGIVHRDIKPANLLLDKNGTVKILDMGLARIDEPQQVGVGATLAERLTRTGQMLGTVDYVSPEQATDTRCADHRSDIYSLGCTLYRLITGKPVYAGESAVQKLMAHFEAEIPSLTDSVPEIPAKLAEVFTRMVAKKPEDRYQSMAEVVTELESCLEAGQTIVRRDAALPPVDRAAPRPVPADEATGAWESAAEPPAGPSSLPANESTVQLPAGQTVAMNGGSPAEMDPGSLARIKVVEGPDSGRVFELREAKSVMGRHPDCDVPIDSMEASRHHAQILLVDGRWYLEDLHSRNGTLINGETVRGRRPLQDGDRIFMGDTAVTFHPGRG